MGFGTAGVKAVTADDIIIGTVEDFGENYAAGDIGED